MRLAPWVLAMSVLVSASSHAATYDDLVALFNDWRKFEAAPMRDGAPDYTAETIARKHKELASWQARLKAIDPKSWPIPQQVDYELVRAEMNGFDFYARVLKPWARDPAWYNPSSCAGARCGTSWRRCSCRKASRC